MIIYKPLKRPKPWHRCQHVESFKVTTSTWGSNYTNPVYCYEKAKYYVQWNQCTWAFGHKDDGYLTTQTPQWVCEEHYATKQGLYGDALYVRLITDRANKKV